MLKKTIEFVDFNGTTRKEDFYFNFSRAEVAEMEMSHNGGLIQHLQKMVAAQNAPELFKFFKELILNSFGEKSPDGRTFIKNQELRDSFEQSEAYSELLMEIVSSENPEKAVADFIEAVLPKNK